MPLIRSRSRHGGALKMLLISFCSALLLMGVGAAAWVLFTRTSGTQIFVNFQDAQGIKSGDKVMLNGMEIGRVQKVTLGGNNAGVEVTTQIDKEIATRIPADSRAAVRSPGITSPFGSKTLEIVPAPDSTAAPVHPGAHLQGLDSSLEEGAWHLGAAVRKTADALGAQFAQLGTMVQTLGDDLQHAIDSPDTRKLQQDMNGFITNLQENGKHAGQKIDEAQHNWPALRARMQAEEERLQHDGKDQLAEKMRRTQAQLEDSMHQTRQQFDKAIPLAEPSPTP